MINIIVCSRQRASVGSAWPNERQPHASHPQEAMPTRVAPKGRSTSGCGPASAAPLRAGCGRLRSESAAVVQALDRLSVHADRAGCGRGVKAVGEGAAGVAAVAGALDDEVADAVAGVDDVVTAVAVELIAAGLAEQGIGATVADQHVVVERALHVLVGVVEADRHAAPPHQHVDPGFVLGEGDVEDAGVGLGLGEGGVVAALAADDGAAGTAAAGCQQVAVAFAVEEGRAWQAADQPIGAVTAIEAVGARAGLDQVVLGTAADRVVALAAGDAHVLGALERALDHQAVVAGAEVGHQPASRGGVTGDLGRGGAVAAGADRDAVAGADAEGRSHLVEGDDELVVAGAADDREPGAAAAGAVELDVGGGLRRRFLAAGGGAPLGARAAVYALAADQLVDPAGAADRVAAGAAVDHVRFRAADQGVAEGRAFDALEAEEPVVAIAARPVAL